METNYATTKTSGRPATTGVIPGRYALSVGMPSTNPPKGWRWVQLTDIARLETGHTPSRRVPEYWGGEVPWIGIRDATENHGRTIYDTYQHTNALGIANSSARILPAETVCLSRTASVGYVIIMGRPMATSQDFVNWVCSSEIDHNYLKYVLLADQDSLWRFASGTTHQTIYFPEVKAFHVCLPPVAEQKAIVKVLGSLDDKIELNRRMNATMDEMVRTLFRSWFVEYEPVKAKTVGKQLGGMDAEIAALFPDSFEESEIGLIPAGWAVKSLDEIAEFLNGLALQKYPPLEDGNDLPVVKIAQLRRGSTEGSDMASSDVPSAFIIDDGDVLFSWSGSLEVALWCGGKGALNQHLFKVSSSEFPKWFYLSWVRYHLPEFQNIAASKATTMGHIQRHHLSDAKVPTPPFELINAATKLFDPLLRQSINFHLQNRKLTLIRDELLPKLISGEVRLPAEVIRDSIADGGNSSPR